MGPWSPSWLETMRTTLQSCETLLPWWRTRWPDLMTYDLWAEVEEVGRCILRVHNEVKTMSRRQTYFATKYWSISKYVAVGLSLGGMNACFICKRQHLCKPRVSLKVFLTPHVCTFLGDASCEIWFTEYLLPYFNPTAKVEGDGGICNLGYVQSESVSQATAMRGGEFPLAVELLLKLL